MTSPQDKVGETDAELRDLDAKRQASDVNSGPPVTHLCAICGSKLAYFGVGVRLLKGQLGTWYCAEHRPEEGEAR
jgi:hypothetical protein